MRRREFGQKLATGVLGASVAGAASAGVAGAQTTRTPRKNTLMHVGGDYHSVAGGRGADMTGKANLEYNLRHGVKHLTAQVRGSSPDGAWDLDRLKRMRDNCDQQGVIFEAIRMDSAYIKLPKGTQRDRRLDSIIGNRRQGHHVSLDGDTDPAEHEHARTGRRYLCRFHARG